MMPSILALETAVLLIIYKRPEETEQVLSRIAKVRPKKLFVAADGPRTPEDSAKCAATRAVIDKVDWECEIYKNYSDTNLRLKNRIISAIDWAFEQTDELIILEDDVVADESFFLFCSALLEKYRHNPEVMHISGANNLVLVSEYVPPPESYFFARYAHVWGWATWRRAWKHYDPEMGLWKNASDKEVFLQHFDRRAKQFWSNLLDYASSEHTTSWAFGWLFTCFAHNGLCIIPRENMITNIGFGMDATHTTKDDSVAHLPRRATPFPLVHPTTLTINEHLDTQDGLYLWRLLDPPPLLSQRLRSRFRGYLGRAKRKIARLARQAFVKAVE